MTKKNVTWTTKIKRNKQTLWPHLTRKWPTFNVFNIKATVTVSCDISDFWNISRLSCQTVSHGATTAEFFYQVILTKSDESLHFSTWTTVRQCPVSTLLSWWNHGGAEGDGGGVLPFTDCFVFAVACGGQTKHLFVFTGIEDLPHFLLPAQSRQLGRGICNNM